MVHGFGSGGSNPLGGTGGVTGAGGVTPTNTGSPSATPAAPAAVAPSTTRAAGLAPTAASVPAYVPGELIKKLAAADTGNTVDLLSKPTSTTSTTVVYRMGGGEGRQLKTGDQIYLEIPPQFRGRPVYMAVFAHRQTQSDKTSVPEDKGTKKWDNTPGSTALHFHSTAEGSDGGWRYWNAPWGASGKQGGKYAELRSGGDPENETEFEFMKNGTSGVSGGSRSTKPLEIDALRLRSVGTDPTRVHSVLVTFMPPKPDSTQEMIFSPGTNMGDPYTAAGRSYGKDKGKGTYPGSLQLGWGGGGEGVAKLADKPGWSFQNGQLQIELTPGKKFTGVEVACGDTHPDGKSNSDGETGTQGWSRLSMGIQRKGSPSVDWFTQGQGVPPQGVIFGGPNQENYVAQPGDKLIIKADADTTYVMGVRTWYNN